MIVPVPWVHIGFGAFVIAASVPLALRKVPMNRWYGVRVRKAFVSESNWYALNAYGGRLFLGVGVFLVAFGAATMDAAPPPTSPWAPVLLAGPLTAIIPVLVLVNALARRLPDS